jgi:hypothetical protein
MSHILMLELKDRRKAIVGIVGSGSGVGTLDDGGLTQDERLWDGEIAVVSRFLVIGARAACTRLAKTLTDLAPQIWNAATDRADFDKVANSNVVFASQLT